MACLPCLTWNPPILIRAAVNLQLVKLSQSLQIPRHWSLHFQHYFCLDWHLFVAPSSQLHHFLCQKETYPYLDAHYFKIEMLQRQVFLALVFPELFKILTKHFKFPFFIFSFVLAHYCSFRNFFTTFDWSPEVRHFTLYNLAFKPEQERLPRTHLRIGLQIPPKSHLVRTYQLRINYYY